MIDRVRGDIYANVIRAAEVDVVATPDTSPR
jgi:hypothetical protein